MKRLCWFLFFTSGLVLAGNYDEDYPTEPPSSYDYKCNYAVKVTAEKEFRGKADAKLWCADLTNDSDICWVEKQGRYKWLASFSLKHDIYSESAVSYADARIGVFEALGEWIEDGGYYGQAFSHVGSFGECG